VVGLGNPGTDLASTRHNVGAEAVELLARRRGLKLKSEKGTRALVATFRELGPRDGKLVVVAVPLTYMNESGLAAAALVRRFGIGDLAQLVVVHDELDLPPGRVKVKLGGGTAGHNGLKSLHAHLHGDGYLRVRIGIGKPPGRRQGVDHVLGRPSRDEREVLDGAIEVAADALEMIAAEGAEVTMNTYNAEP
jgi:PTH1 family peptidyl-tRNA hydrolase